MAELTLPPQAQQLLLQMQTFQQQLQTVAMQRESLTVQSIEISKALEELKKLNKEDVFKAVGPILVKSDKLVLEKELNEKKETIELRLKSLEKQENKLKERLEENQKSLEDIIKTTQKGSSAN